MPRPFRPFPGALVLLAWLSAWGGDGALGHVTDPLNVPLFSEQAQGRLSLELGRQGEGLHAQGGFALGPRLAVVGAGSYAQLNNCLACTISERRHAELGFGTFLRGSTGWVSEAYAGFGTGRFKASADPDSWDPETEELRVTGGVYKMGYLQANIGRQFRFTDRAASLRLSAWRFNRFTKVDGNGTPFPVDPNHLSLYLEPGILYRVGYKALKAEAQMGLSIPLREADGLEGELVWFSLGIGLDVFKAWGSPSPK